MIDLRSRPRGRTARLLATLGLLAAVGLAGLGNDGEALAVTSPVFLIAAPLSIAPAGTITVDLRLPDGASAPTEVKVSGRRISDTGGNLGGLLAAVGTAEDTVLLAGPAVTTTDGTVRLSIPTETATNLAGSLSLVKSGTYALEVRIPGAAALTIPMVRRADSTPFSPVPVTFVLDLDAPLSLQPDGSTSISDATRDAVIRLTKFLAASTVPVAVSVRPELVDSLMRSDQQTDRDLVNSLAESFGRQRLLSSPYLHIDPSVAANANASADFTNQLRFGEDTLSNALRRLPDRRIWVANEALSPAGSLLVRNLGAAVVVQAAGIATDRAAPGTARPDGGVVQPVLVPSDIHEELAAAAEDPVLAAHIIAVGLLRSKQVESRPAVVIMPDLGTANAEVLAALTSLLSLSDVLRAVDIEQVGVGTSTPAGSGATAVGDFSAAHARRAKLLKLVAGTAAIIPSSDRRRIDWSIRADVLLDTRLADDDRAAYETQLRADLLDVQNNVVLQAPKAVNLGDRTASIPVTIQNNNDVPITVTVRLVSGKLTSPPTSEELTVEPGATEFVRIPVRARSSGRFPVTAQLLAPGTKTVIGKKAVINVRVGRLTGLGIVFTFAAGLVLLSWWGQHFRRRVRRDETAEFERRKLAGLPIDDFDELFDDPDGFVPDHDRRRDDPPRSS